MKQTTGTVTALSSGFSGALTTILIWHLNRHGIEMSEAVAVAHVTVAIMLGGALAHYIQGYFHLKESQNEKANSGGFGGAPTDGVRDPQPAGDAGDAGEGQ